MPTLFTIFGLRFFFYANEHLPIHVHIENGDGKAKIQVDPDVRIVENHGIKNADIKKALSFAELYRDEIIKEWHAFHGE